MVNQYSTVVPDSFRRLLLGRVPSVARSRNPIVLFVRLAVIVAVSFALFVFLAPYAPEGSFIETAGLNLREIMAAWWGQPIGFG